MITSKNVGCRKLAGNPLSKIKNSCASAPLIKKSSLVSFHEMLLKATRLEGASVSSKCVADMMNRTWVGNQLAEP
ncbi:hypothetical protein GN244_ATG20398 [Phytophthora infestans]|uniref:Uncharacterized protein n=1 Tax=Phytophthora infestans TaxID=4787 RepID=A0A833ST18_PHYIN|nr:hypothetical protein GN244_ATG20398 [Phytophthora infestans]KAF4129361.1 hypothetical protein GN958_ATG21447 [Phytophthora infestans]KAF4134978.1 hypothetical protein GN958_ATG15835 [Phytophthora infestans]